jgi:DNA-binding transcriptional MerR regulator
MVMAMGSAVVVSEGGWTIREVAEKTGITVHTLRYYERIGLVQPVARARSGHRRYGEDDLRWLGFLRKLHATNMPIRTMLEYARLVRRGESTTAARRALLDAHRADVEENVEQLRSALAVIRRKVAIYDRALAAGHEAPYVAAVRGRQRSIASPPPRVGSSAARGQRV